PNRLLGLAYLALAAGAIGEWALGSPPLVPAIAGAASFAFLLVLAIAGGLGAGDVKLGGALGCAAGFVGPTTAALSPALAFTTGGVVAVVLLATGGRGRRLAFGPYLLLGFWMALAVGLVAGAG
ncbi:MAG: prepilin peptidase, partial [Rhodoglobus sp.]|nr:prepilin peptidase [Rhodoglobus sp.]